MASILLEVAKEEKEKGKMKEEKREWIEMVWNMSWKNITLIKMLIVIQSGYR